MSLTTVTVCVLALCMVGGCFADKSIIKQTVSTNDILLTCTLTEGAAPNAADFFKDGVTDTKVAVVDGIQLSTNTLKILNANIDAHKGEYQCTGAGGTSTISDKVVAGQATLTKTEKTAPAADVGDVVLTCDDVNTPVFKKDNTDVVEKDPELVIATNTITIKKDSIETHKGKYQCAGAVLSTLSEPVQVGSSAGKVMTSAIIIPLCMLVTSLM